MRALKFGAAVLLLSVAVGARSHAPTPADPCPAIAAAIVSSGDYVGGADVRACVGEEDDPRVAVLLGMSRSEGVN